MRKLLLLLVYGFTVLGQNSSFIQLQTGPPVGVSAVNVSGTNTWTNNTFSNNDRKAHTVKISPSTLVSDGGGNKCNWVWTPLNPVPYPITCTQ